MTTETDGGNIIRLSRAAESTVEALMYSLRQRGAAALSEPDCQRRLRELSQAQLGEVITRLTKLRAIYPAVTDKLLFVLSENFNELV